MHTAAGADAGSQRGDIAKFASPRTAVIVKPAARTCRSNVRAWRHFSKDDVGMGASAGPRQPILGQYAPQETSPDTGPQRDGRRHFAICDFAERQAAERADRVALVSVLVPSRIKTPRRSGITARNRRHTSRRPKAHA